MPETVIANASCLVVLTKIGELAVLQRVCGTVVAAEYGKPPPARGGRWRGQSRQAL